jgi:hypothetical protein
MPRQKKTSRILEKVELRVAGLKAVDPQMDFGNDRSIDNLMQFVNQIRTRLDAYNTALAVIDSSKTEIQQLEKTMADLSEQMLLGVAFKYGKDSSEYEMAGGVRKSERIRRSSVSRLKANPKSGSDVSKTA